MKILKLFILFSLVLFSCSKKDKDLVDIESFLKEGKKINLIKENKIFNKDISSLKSINISVNQKYSSWEQDYYNSRNFLYPSNINLKKISKSLSGKFQNVLIYKNLIVTIKSNSEIIIYNKNFKKILSKKIYKRKIIKNYDLKFKSIIHKNKLILADNLGNLHSINLKDLKIAWKKEFGVPFISTIKIYNEDIYLINSNSKIFSINIDNGNLNWSFETASNNLKNSKSYQMAIYDDNLVFTNDNGEVYCLNIKERGVKWSFVLENQAFSKNPIIFESSPLIIDDVGTLFVSSNYGFTYAINIANGNIKWSSPISTSVNLMSYSNYLFFVNENRFLILENSTGEVLYNKKYISSKKKLNIIFKDLFVSKSNIYLFTNHDEVIVLNNKNFNKISKIKIPSGYKNFLIDKNNFFIKTNKSISKF